MTDDEARLRAIRRVVEAYVPPEAVELRWLLAQVDRLTAERDEALAALATAGRLAASRREHRESGTR